MWMSDNEIRLAIARPAHFVVADPLDVMEDNPGIILQFAGEGFIQSSLGGR
jgi:hypothetical protein